MDPFSRALDWLRQDPDPETRAELQTIVDRQDHQEINRLFSQDLAFGTAGLRGQIGCGPNRMNRLVVARTAAGLAQYLRSEYSKPRIVIGFDARHKSVDFARESAEVMQGAGLDVLVLPKPLPTPVLAFAIRYLGADAGVMVTASHNPASDNGYKVYLGDGTQIAAPTDTHITQHIRAIGAYEELPRNSDFIVLGDDIETAYINAICEAHTPRTQAITIAYTPMHGVGAETFLTAAERCGFNQIHVVDQQREADPDFPTLSFPNPEEAGAMDMLLDLAAKHTADIAIAHDPDADRLAVAIRVDDGHRTLTGDELGCLLARRLLHDGTQGTFANSIVSSRQLGLLAKKHGQQWKQTLTGFKWIGKVEALAYGYEEALGYCVRPDLSGDKDGISAALLVLAYANDLTVQGLTLQDEVDALAKDFGIFATSQVAIRCADSEYVYDLLAALTTARPQSIAGLPVLATRDLSRPDQDLPATPGLVFDFGPELRILCRPSGTEPKLKCYLETHVPVTTSIMQARTEAAAKLALAVNDIRSLMNVLLIDSRP